MYSFFEALKAFFKTGKAEIDNYVFRLHYRLTLIILVAFSVVVTGKQYIGDPIDCISRDDIPSELLDTFCWVHTTFSLPDSWKKKVGDDVPYPGVDKYTKGEKRVYHAYYQWVCFVLFLQAILFHLPRYFWKSMEGNRMKTLTMDLGTPLRCSQEKLELLVQYIISNKNNHKFYYFSYCLAELLNFINVLGQIFLMDRFLGGEFSLYGHKVLQFTEWEWSVRYDPMIKVFPRLAKCTFHRYGSSGDVQRHDAMCILPINIINEKIYIFLWFWFVLLTIITGLTIIYRILTFLLPKLRYHILRSRSNLIDSRELQDVLTKMNAPSDWYVLYLLSKNINEHNFSDTITELSSKLGN